MSVCDGRDTVVACLDGPAVMMPSSRPWTELEAMFLMREVQSPVLAADWLVVTGFIDAAAIRFLITLAKRPSHPALARVSVRDAGSPHPMPSWRPSPGSPGPSERCGSIPRWREGTAGGQA